MPISREILYALLLATGIFGFVALGWHFGHVLLALAGFFLAIGLEFLWLEFRHLIENEPKSD